MMNAVMHDYTREQNIDSTVKLAEFYLGDAQAERQLRQHNS